MKREWFEKYYKCKYLGKCYCKDTFIFNGIEIFIKGNEYDCYIEDKDETYKRTYLKDCVSFWIVYNYKGILGEQVVRFNIRSSLLVFCDKINLEYNSYKFYDYFYNEKEVRCIKLKKLMYE